MNNFSYLPRILIFICIYFLITNGASASFVTNCISTKNIDIQYKNFYHGFIYKKGWNNDILEGIAKQEICTSYALGGSPDDITLKQIIPVYMPKNSVPKLYQFVYTGQDYLNKLHTGSELLWGTTGYASIPPTGLTWFWSGGFGWKSGWDHGTDAYLTSQKEPFASAPMLQMYYYLGQPLLVARSSTGIVTDVFFQGRTVADPIERAKKYLGKKWYSP